MFKADDLVRNERFGLGHVLVESGGTVVVRYEHGIEQCLASELVAQLGPAQALVGET